MQLKKANIKIAELFTDIFIRISQPTNTPANQAENAGKFIFFELFESFISVNNPRYPELHVMPNMKANVLKNVIEIYANAHSIYSHANPETQAQDFMSYGYDYFTEITRKIKNQDDRPFRIWQVNGKKNWDGQGIEKRIDSLPDPLVVHRAYDQVNIFTHVNPAKVDMRETILTTGLFEKSLNYYTVLAFEKIIQSGVILQSEVEKLMITGSSLSSSSTIR
jgi:hypothetical protein